MLVHVGDNAFVSRYILHAAGTSFKFYFNSMTPGNLNEILDKYF